MASLIDHLADVNYDEEISFVDPPPYDVRCAVCFEVFDDQREAYQTSCCGNHICCECNNGLRNDTCPFCRKAKFCTTSDKFFLRQVLSLQVECHNCKRGCPWTGELRALNQHIQETCKKNFAKCKYCQFQGPHKAFPKHIQVCTETPLACPNLCPFKQVKRKDLKRHLEQECSLRVVGVARNGVPHAANKCVQVAPLSVTMTNYSRYVRTGDIWYSPPFYTHENGYKLHLRVDADWYKKGYVSVLVCVLKGEHDRTLTWPLYCEVEVALYNWRTNKPLYSKVLYLPGDVFCSYSTINRPAAWGKGNVEFISHASLAHDLEKNTEYVQHDCLNFLVRKVTIIPAPPIPQLPRWVGDNCFVVPSFRSMKQKNLSFYGPPLYTHRGGYKICPRVDANGFGEGKGTHISVSCTVMSGENDDALSWPLSADVVITMFNWRENKQHRDYTIGFNKGPSNARATTVGMGKYGWGSPKFAAHSSLPYNSNTKTEFLKEDCLIFKITSIAVYTTENVIVVKLPSWINPATGSLYPCFTLSDFAKRKAIGNEYYSNPFYSHHNGYKMQLHVYAAKDQNNIGMFVFLMKGPTDDQLQWPFRGDVVVELVNWRSDRGHHSKITSFSFNCTPTACARVMDGERSPTSWGYEYFIPHSSLPYNAQTGTEYLQNDCLHFRVKEVAVYSTPLMYKVPLWQNYHSISPSFQFTLNSFSKRKQLRSDYIGPAFYTHRGGYRMRLKVTASRNDQSNHIALYAQLLKGENDATLSWPLTANIVVELLNWRQDGNHHSYNIGLTERLPSCHNCRVTEKDSADSWGTHEFIAYRSLPYNHSTNTEYLQDDCLCFRVKKLMAYSTSLARKVPRWQMRNPSNFFEFTVTDVSERMQFDNCFYSPSFSASNYKMCLSVYVGGNKSAKDRNVSIYASMLKGEHDETLEWPFCGDITVQVLNWSGDHGHYKKVISLNDLAKPTADIIEPEGYGVANFMPISTLFSSYLEEGCMRIQVSNIALYNTPLRFKTPRWQGRWSASSDCPCAFTATGFSNRMINGTRCDGPPFYTHKRGYKMRLEVRPEQSGADKGNLSIYARLLQGEHDSSLKWPMNVDLTVQLVNWAKNASHITKIIKFGSAGLEYRTRVQESGGAASCSWGFGKFCSLGTLYTRLHNVEYVEEDCIRIQVKGVIIHSRGGIF